METKLTNLISKGSTILKEIIITKCLSDLSLKENLEKEAFILSE